MARPHPTPVSASADPAARRAKRAFTTLSASAVGIEMGISVILGALFGRWLDSKAGTTPWLMILFLVLGFVAGMRSVLRTMKTLDREDRDRHAEGEGGSREPAGPSAPQEAHRG